MIFPISLVAVNLALCASYSCVKQFCGGGMVRFPRSRAWKGFCAGSGQEKSEGRRIEQGGKSWARMGSQLETSFSVIPQGSSGAVVLKVGTTASLSEMQIFWALQTCQVRNRGGGAQHSEVWEALLQISPVEWKYNASCKCNLKFTSTHLKKVKLILIYFI